LLQAVQGIEFVLGDIASAAGLDQFRIQRQHFLLCAFVVEGRLIGLRGLDLSPGAGRLRANIGVVELQQQLPLAHVVALLHQQAFYRGRDGSVGLEILNGLNLPVGGNQAADGSSFGGDRAYFHRSLVEIGVQDRQDSQQCEREPNPPPSGRRMRIVRRCQPVVFQAAAGITVSSNLPLRRQRQIPEDASSTVSDWMRAAGIRLHVRLDIYCGCRLTLNLSANSAEGLKLNAALASCRICETLQ